MCRSRLNDRQALFLKILQEAFEQAPTSNGRQSMGSKRLSDITCWYGKHGNFDPSAPGQESRILGIHLDSNYGSILNIFQDLLDGQTDPTQTAEALSSLVLSKEDPGSAWQNMIGVVCTAAQFATYANCMKLADVLVPLAKLPHALPPDPEIDDEDAEPREFAALPYFSVTLTESMQRPRQYFCNMGIVTCEAQIAAGAQWRNFSTFAAVISRHYLQERLPSCADRLGPGLIALAEALQYGEVRKSEASFPDTEYVHLIDRPLLWLPAACQWTLIAGREIHAAALGDPEGMKYPAGPIWVAAGGDGTLGMDRWHFWRRRSILLADCECLAAELRESLAEAARKMERDGVQNGTRS